MMRYFDKQLNPIDQSQVDLSKGFLVTGAAVKEDATPIDNIKKFAWADDDYEEVEIFVQQDPPSYDELVNAEIRKRYSESQEFSILRQKEEKPEEYQEYFDYCEQCKASVKSKKAINIGGKNNEQNYLY